MRLSKVRQKASYRDVNIVLEPREAEFIRASHQAMDAS